MLTTSHRSVKRLSPSMGRKDQIEWEDLPSFADSLTKRLVMLGAHADANAPAWIETMAAELVDMGPPSEPFREPLQGLHTREVHEPEVFRLFFGEH